MMISSINISLYAHTYVSTDSSYRRHESKLAHGMFCILEIELKKKYCLHILSFRHPLLLARRMSTKNLTENSLCMFIIRKALDR